MSSSHHALTAALVAFVFACGSSADPTPTDAGSSTDDASSVDAGFAPIPCGDLTCAGSAPYCLKASTCGFGPADCTTPTSDAGACPDGYATCEDSSGKPGCASLYTYTCVAGSSCELIAPRIYGNCNC